MQTYQSMKDSGVEWLGYIPSTWGVKRAKYIFNRVQEKPNENDEVVTAFRDGEVILRNLRREDGFTFADKEIGYQHVSQGDLVVHAMDAFAGAIGVSKSEGKMSPVCSICRPVSEDVDTEYYAYLLRSMTKMNYLVAIAKGIRERSTDFRYSDLGNMSLPLPSLDEQRQIVTYLNKQLSKIDSLIAKQTHLLELLEEKRHAIIASYIVFGCNDENQVKKTTVKWLPSIAANAKIMQLKYVLNLNTGGAWGEEPTGSNDVVVLRSTEQSVDGSWILLNPAERHLSASDYAKTKLKRGDLVVTKSSGSERHIGKTSVVDERTEGLSYSNFMQRLRLIDGENPRFYWYLLNSRIAREQYNYYSNSTSGLANLNSSIFNSLFFAHFEKDIQDQIVKCLDQECKTIESLRFKISAQVVILKERRNSLISNVTTGKVKV